MVDEVGGSLGFSLHYFGKYLMLFIFITYVYDIGNHT